VINATPSLRKARLLAGAATAVAFLSLGATPVFAQDAPAAQDTPAAGQTDQAADAGTDIVVTGSLFRRTDTETPSPVTVLTSDDIAKRGITTVQGAIQSLSANNGPALTNSFTANGAFAGGASSVSLRGLTTSSTLVLFDGLRAAYYPLADDGTRNFVDLNTIPDAIVDRVEVLKDGASSTYGADAVAGVVNIITKKEIKGLHATAEAGVSQRGDAANHRLSATFGYGDLSEQGFNVYVSGHYLDQAALYNRDREYPFNTDDQTGICARTGTQGQLGVCGPNNIANGVTNGLYNGFSTAPDVFVVRPYDATNTNPLGAYQLLNGCGNLTPYTLTDAQLAAANTDGDGNPLAVPVTPRNVCQQDITHDYGQIEPQMHRYGGSAHLTANVLGGSELTAEVNYEHSYSAYTGLASIFRANAPAGIDYPAYSTSAGATVVTLPVYVCARGTTAACTAANGTLNPNNPFAAQGQVARVAGRLPTSTEFNSSQSDTFRAALGLHGSFGDDWNYAIDGTAMVSKLKTTAKGYVYIQHLLDEVADGSYNFVNPGLTSQAALDYLTPTQINKQNSHLYQVQGSISKDFFQLPGGPLQVAVGGAFRHESLYDPSGNPDYAGPTERYFRLNAFGATGKREVESAYFEINAPVLDVLEINGSGRFDHYSTGQSNFSPKIGAKFTPIKQLAIRGTFSKGFRIPSFAESGALPTSGYVTVNTANLPKSFTDQHLTSTGQFNNYLTTYSIGQTTVGNPDLKPEKSRNFTLGAVFEPIHNISFTVDYYNIQKTNAITSVNFQSAVDNYYATGELNYNGVTIIQDEADVDHPTGQKRVAFAQGSFINANKIHTSGLDFGARGQFNLGSNVKYTTSLDATYIIDLNTSFPDGHTEHYAGTLGNFNLTAGSGTQRWRGNWQNTLDVGPWSLTATAYYTSGYNYSAEDQGNVAGDCGYVPTNLDGQAYQPCNVKSFISVDLHGQVKVDDRFTLYADVMNVADRKAPIDAATYGAYLYNPVVAEAGIIGRSFRVGAKVDF
jgi:iron complex outermembrane receptor protein